MADKTKELDIVQRIVEVAQRTSVPLTPSGTGEVKPEYDTVLGEVPWHLRHVHNLLQEIGNEVREAEYHYRSKVEEQNGVHKMFFSALEHYAPANGEYIEVKLCDNWQVVGTNESAHEESAHPIERILSQIAKEL